MNITHRLEGVGAVLHHYQALPREVAPVFAEALELEALHILERALPLVPVRLGDLVESGRVDDTRYEGNEIEVDIVFGDEIAWYAWIIHEDMDMYHDDGQAKYLEQPALEESATSAVRIAAHIRERMR